MQKRKYIFISVFVLCILLFCLCRNVKRTEEYLKAEVSPAPSVFSAEQSLLESQKKQVQKKQYANSVGTRDCNSKIFTIESSSGANVIASFELPTFEIETVQEEQKGRTFSLVSADGAFMNYEKGKPAMPFYRTELALSTNCKYDLEILDADYDEVDAAPPMPGIGINYDDLQRRKYEPDSQIYDGNGVWPSENVRVAEQYVLRALAGCGVVVAPFQYDWSSLKLKICRRLRFSLTRRGEGEEPVLDGNESFSLLQAGIFANSSYLSTSPSVSGVVLMIVPDGWRSSVNDFVHWKRQLGLEVMVAEYPLETGENSEMLRAFIRNGFESNAVSHLILCGDSEQIPPYQYASNREKPGTVSGKITSDVPYAEMTEDGMPDLLLSRISAKDYTSLHEILGRIVDFESASADKQEPGKKSREHGVFLASAEQAASWEKIPTCVSELGYKTYPYDYEVIGNIADIYDKAGIFECTSRIDGRENKNTVREKLFAALNEGCSLVHYLGHGTNYSLKTGDFAVEDVGDLGENESDVLPFYFIPVCNAGNFVAEKECFAEALLQQNAYRASGVFAATSSTYWYPPIVETHRFAETLSNLRNSGRLNDIGTIILDAVIAGNAACSSLDEQGSGNTSQYNMWVSHLFGDCTQLPRIGKLGQLDVNYTVSGPGEQKLLTVRVSDAKDKMPIERARVCIQLGENKYVSQVTDKEGVCSLAYDAPLEEPCIRVVHPAYFVARIEIKKTWKPELPVDENGVVTDQAVLDCLASLRASGNLAEWREWVMQTWQERAPVWQKTTQNACLQTQGKGKGGACKEETQQMLLDLTGEAERQAMKEMNLPVVAWSKGLGRVLVTPDQEKQLLQKNIITRGEDNEKLSTGGKMRADDGYLSFDEILLKIQALSADYWPACQVNYIGQSIEGRDILGIRISLRKAEENIPQLLVCAGIHGDEKPGPDIAIRLAEYLLSGNEECKDLLRRAAIWIVPVCNPDGYAADQRNNAWGYDLNRNFPDGIEISNLGMLEEGAELYFDSGIMQPEQLALARWLAGHHFSVALHLHTGAELICYPYGNSLDNRAHEAISPDDDLFKWLAEMYVSHSVNIDKIINANLMYPAIGELADWQYRVLGTLPLTLELYDGAGRGKKKIPIEEMDTLWNNNQAAFMAFFRAALSGVEGVVVASPSEQPLPAKVNVQNGKSIFADAKGYFHRCLLPGRKENLIISAPETSPVIITLEQSEVEEGKPRCSNVVLQPEKKNVLSLIMEDKRQIPGWDNHLKLFNLDSPGGGWTGDFIIYADLPKNWVIEAADMGGKNLRWRRTEDGRWAFLVSEDSANETINMSIITSEQVSESLMSWQIRTVSASNEARKKHWFGRQSYVAPLDLNGQWQFIALPGILRQSDIMKSCSAFAWKEKRFVPITKWEGGLLIKAEKKQTVDCLIWRSENDDWKIEDGWNLISRSWPRKAETGCWQMNNNSFVQKDKATGAIWLWQSQKNE